MKRPLWLSIAIAILTCTSALAAAEPNTPWLGVLWTKGTVSLGSANVPSGTTVLPGDKIYTFPGASAWIRFRSPASTTLLADTEVVLLASDAMPSFMLRRGTVIVDEMVVDPIQVAVPGGYVLVKGDPQSGAECEMTTVGNAATVTVKRGLAEIRSQGAPVFLHSGQSARVEASPEGNGQVAGKVNKEIPSGMIEREGQTQELPMSLNEVVNWNDLIHTLETGRAQITLLDGSTLNVGARSKIKIIKHDPQAQQTEIELISGRIHATAEKITTPGGKFELRTKSAVVGTIDTSYVAETNDQGTEVCDVEGTTKVQSSDPNIQGSVILKPGECTWVAFGAAPTPAVANPGMLASMLSLTNIANLGTVGAAGAGGAATSGFPWVWVGIGAGAAAAAGIAAAVVTSSGPPVSPSRP